MTAPPLREQVLSLLDTANNQGDLAVKISSLKQARDILLSAEPSQAAGLFPFLVELLSSPESLVRKTLVDVIEDIGLKMLEHSCILMPVLLTLLKDDDSLVARQSIITGRTFFCIVLEELSMQRGIVEMWHEELWAWMVKLKDAVLDILFEAAPLGLKLLTIKFLETHILLLTSDASESERSTVEAIPKEGRTFNISWLVSHHPFLDPTALSSDANRSMAILLDLLQSASNLPSLLAISVVNSLAAIARRRPTHCNSVLSALLEFDPHFAMPKGGHTASIQYAIRTAFLGLLRCTHPVIIESRERLLKALRAMNAGDAADQVVRQVEKMMRSSGRASRDARVIKDEQPPNHLPSSGDQGKKRSTPLDSDGRNNDNDIAQKRFRYGPNSHAPPSVGKNGLGQEHMNGLSPNFPLLDSNLTPVEQMISMIGALLAEGERGVKSLELLIANIHPDLLADIIITNMRHLPKTPPPVTRVNTPTLQGDSCGSSQGAAPVRTTVSVQTPDIVAEVPATSSNANGSSLFDLSSCINPTSDSKRDPRRDPRRLDPRRLVASVSVPSAPVTEDNPNARNSGELQYPDDGPSSPDLPFSPPTASCFENSSISPIPKSKTCTVIEDSSKCDTDPLNMKELEETTEVVPQEEGKYALDVPSLSTSEVEQDLAVQKSSDLPMVDETYSPPFQESDDLSPAISDAASHEDASAELPVVPAFVALTEEQQRNVRRFAMDQIFYSCEKLREPASNQNRIALLARLVAQIDAEDEAILILQKHLASDYHCQQGHELVMHVLYHLQSLTVLNIEQVSSYAATMYEKFLTAVAKSLVDTLPSTDKSFSRLLGEAPLLTDSVIRLLDDLCCEKYSGKGSSDGDRVTQGLGAVWSLILGRPLNRQSCLDIALKCAVHPKDDIRAKAIRLVANKLYVLGYISETIEQFATRMFLSALYPSVSDVELPQPGATKQRTEPEVCILPEVGSQETSIIGSQVSEAELYESDSVKGALVDTQSDSLVTATSAMRHISLFFALCPKKPTLLRLVFDNYARAPKAVKQAVHRQMPVLVRALTSSYSELLHIISDSPQGCENLLTQVIHILSEGTTPPPDLVATVKHLYETKLKDASIMIPILPSLSKTEVLPIIPRLVDLPSDKFQTALAHILQGSAHTGPALTPAEVMVAIHDINPDRDGLQLKKIMDACSVCFEQQTVFTQQVMTKALNHMVDQTPLPLLFMRTVIQTTDAFPSLVWRMPKLWVGFLKCVSQTQPHSFRVLLQLPSPQLESALNKYPRLRGPLITYANQPSVKNSLPRSTLMLLGLANESHMEQAHLPSSLHAPDTNSSVNGPMST